MLRETALVGLMVLAQSWGCGTGASAQSVSPIESVQNEKALLKQIWPVLRAANRPGRIYYEALCASDDDVSVRFPKFEIEPPAPGEKGIDAIRSMFRDRPDVTVAEGDHGIVRIYIGRAPTHILGTKIRVRKFAPEVQYDDTLVVDGIVDSREVQDEMKKLGLRAPKKVFDMVLQGPTEGYPHVPAEISNVTMDQALDIAAETFKGVVLYGACETPKAFDVAFVGGANFDDRWFDEKY